MGTTRTDALALGSEFARAFRVDTVSGFASNAGNGSAAITGLSGASDAPLAAFVAEISFTTLRKITLASINFVANRVRIDNTDTSSKQLLIHWWNRK